MSIKQFFTELFSETGHISMTRFLSFITVLAAIAIAIIGVYKGTNLDGLAMLCGAFLGSGLGAKVFQKFAEIKGEVSDTENK